MASTINALNTSSGVAITPDSSGILQLQTAGTTAVTVDASQNVGIGNTSPGFPLDIGKTVSSINAKFSDGTRVIVLGNDSNEPFFGTSTNNSLRILTNNTERARIDSSGNVLVTGGGGLGYGTGSGGTVTQATSKSTAVTLSKSTGQITMSNAALAANTIVTFNVNNSLVTTSDTVILSLQNQVTSLVAYRLEVAAVNSGNFVVRLTNITAGSLSDAVVFNFAIIKGATA